MTTTNLAASVNTSPYRVLLIGDESVSRQMLIDLLRQRGHDVVKARSANEAEKALGRRVDAVVVDQRVRGTNGLAWVRRLRGNGHTMPVVFCSTSNCSSKTYKTLLKVLGVSAIVHKPLVPVVLANQIESLLPEYCEHPRPISVEDENVAVVEHNKLDGAAYDFTPEVPVVSSQFSSDPAVDLPDSWQSDYDAELETRQALKELGRTYINDVPEMLYELRAQIAKMMESGPGPESETLQLATTTAHQMKGTAGSLGFPELSRLAGKIEMFLLSMGDVAVPETLARALIVVAEIEDWVEAWRDENCDAPKSKTEPECKSPQPLEKTAELELEKKAEPEKLPEKIMEKIPNNGPGDLQFKCSNSVRALIIDTDAVRLGTLTSALSHQFGTAVESMPCSVKVLTALEEIEPNFVIIDAEGADSLSGFDICRMIRCHPRWATLPILLMISDASSAGRQAVYACGAGDFILKPLVEEELRGRIDLLLNSSNRLAA